jgi:hypothetical protein
VSHDEEFVRTIANAQGGLAAKRRTRSAHGQVTKFDPTLRETYWRLWRFRTELDVDKIVKSERFMALRRDLAALHGDPAPGIDPNQWVRRWSSESHGAERTIIDASRYYIPIDCDGGLAPHGSALDRGEHLYAAAEYMREVLLPPALRDVDLAIAAASSTGFKPGLLSLHAYALLDRSAPLQVIYQWLAGAQAAGYPLDPRPALCGQLFLTSRPVLIGLDDPVPRDCWAFVLPGWRHRVTSIDWNEFEPQRAVLERTERWAHVAGAELGWRVVLERHLGDGDGKLGFFRALTISLGYAARSSESADEIVGAMHAIVCAHPDLNAERAGQYTVRRLRQELLRFRAKDAAREASIDARIDAIRGKFPGLGFLT